MIFFWATDEYEFKKLYTVMVLILSDGLGITLSNFIKDG